MTSLKRWNGSLLTRTDTRIWSIFRKIKEQGVYVKKVIIPKVNYKLFMKDSEKELIKMLAEFPAMIDKAAEELKPSLIAHLLIDISQKFTAFYHECPILNEDVEL